FVEVVERGSFTAEAKEFNLTQPAATHQAQEVERPLQQDLVGRFRKRACQTQAGEGLIEDAPRRLEEDSPRTPALRRDGAAGARTWRCDGSARAGSAGSASAPA